MSHLVCRRVGFEIDSTPILRDITLSVTEGKRIGLIGPNGVGKTTLLRLLCAELTPSTGTVERHPVDLPVGLLRQEIRVGKDLTLLHYLALRTGVASAEVELEEAAAEIAERLPGAADRYSLALQRWTQLGCADFAHRSDEVMEGVGLRSSMTSRTVASLSGGQAARLDLAAVLLHSAPILLLDEPTNDLDLAGLELLEESLLNPGRGLVIVSHDRALLEKVVTDVVEIDEVTDGAQIYAGGWGHYEKARRDDRMRAEEAHARYQAERARLEEQAKRQRQWREQGVRRAKRMPSDADKFVRRAAIAGAESRGRAARRTEDRLARLTPVAKPWEGWELKLRLETAARSGEKVVEVTDVIVRRGDFTLGPVTAQVNRDDRIAVSGPNGAGKTTLLRVLLGVLSPDSGRQWMGPSVVTGRLDQGRAQLDCHESLLSGVVALSGSTSRQARSSLAKLGLGAEFVARPPADLSPGERTRAVLATFQLRGVNLLVLDEPTNHLDLPAIEQLEQSLSSFPGTLILVSHDRRFVEAVAVNRHWGVSEGRLQDHQG